MAEVNPVNAPVSSSAAAPPRGDCTPFVVITMQRTGSGWVMDRINNVPSAQGHMELFHHHPRQRPPQAGCNDYLRFVEMRDQLPKERVRAVFAYLDGLYQRPGAVGFKLMYSQLSQHPEILYYLARRRVRIIHLVRHNLLDILVSEELARVTGTAHVAAGEKMARVQVALEPMGIVARLRRLSGKRRIIRGLLALIPNRVEEVAYEALCNDPGEFGRLCDFLGIPAELEDVANTKLVKRQRASHDEVLLNYPQVEDALRRGGYQGLLH